VNTLASLDAKLAEERVLGWQTKLHRWAAQDEQQRFGDLFNLVCDPATLLVAWERVKRNRGSRTAGVDGQTRKRVEQAGVDGVLAKLREEAGNSSQRRNRWTLRIVAGSQSGRLESMRSVRRARASECGEPSARGAEAPVSAREDLASSMDARSWWGRSARVPSSLANRCPLPRAMPQCRAGRTARSPRATSRSRPQGKPIAPSRCR
jgi:hypothetical protein